jgi:fumigaclavine B O-acetyltransferase
LDHTIKNFYFSAFISFPLHDPDVAVPALKDGVERLVYALPALSGVMASSSRLPGKRNVIEIHPSPESLEWIPMLQFKYHRDTTLVATCSSGSSGVSSFDESWSSLPIIIPEGRPSPVARFQAHVFPDGILLCLTLTHAVFDGSGLGTILKMLATCCINSTTHLSLSLPTSYAKEASSRQIILDSALPPSASNIEAYRRMFESNDIIPGLEKDVSSRRLSIPASKIRALNDACNAARPTDQEPILSKTDVLTALLAICMNRARKTKTNDLPSSLAVPVNLRKKFHPSLLDSYLGNTFITLIVDIDPPAVNSAQRCRTTPFHADLNELMTLSLRIRKQLILLDQKAYTGGLISYLREQSDWGASSVRFADITVSSLRYLGINGLDFGPVIGRVNTFDLQSGMYPGICDILPNRVSHMDDTGGMNMSEAPMDVAITLEGSAWNAFMEDRLMLWALDAGYRETGERASRVATPVGQPKI